MGPVNTVAAGLDLVARAEPDVALIGIDCRKSIESSSRTSAPGADGAWSDQHSLLAVLSSVGNRIPVPTLARWPLRQAFRGPCRRPNRRTWRSGCWRDAQRTPTTPP